MNISPPTSWENLDEIVLPISDPSLIQSEEPSSHKALLSKLCSQLLNLNSASLQREKVNKLANSFAKKHNQFQIFRMTPLLYVNIDADADQFEAWVIGFDGRAYPARIMLDTGCVCNGVIATRMAKKAGIVQDKYGCSYAFVIKKDNRTFIGTAISKKNDRGQMCYIKNNTQTLIGKNKVDILMSYESMEEMYNCIGCFPAITNVIPTSVITIPYSYRSDLKCTIGNIECLIHIDTGCTADVDIYLSDKWLDQYKKSGVLRISSEQYLPRRVVLGKIHKLTLRYKQYLFVFEDLDFVSIGTSQDLDNDVDCVPTQQFMRRLKEKNVIPCFV